MIQREANREEKHGTKIHVANKRRRENIAEKDIYTGDKETERHKRVF